MSKTWLELRMKKWGFLNLRFACNTSKISMQPRLKSLITATKNEKYRKWLKKGLNCYKVSKLYNLENKVLKVKFGSKIPEVVEKDWNYSKV